MPDMKLTGRVLSFFKVKVSLQRFETILIPLYRFSWWGRNSKYQNTQKSFLKSHINRCYEKKSSCNNHKVANIHYSYYSRWRKSATLTRPIEHILNNNLNAPSPKSVPQHTHPRNSVALPLLWKFFRWSLVLAISSNPSTMERSAPKFRDRTRPRTCFILRTFTMHFFVRACLSVLITVSYSQTATGLNWTSQWTNSQMLFTSLTGQ